MSARIAKIEKSCICIFALWIFPLALFSNEGLVLESLSIKSTHVYKTVGNKELDLDLFHPKSASDQHLPIVVYIHEGLRKGNRNELLEEPFLADTFVQLLSDGKIKLATIEFRRAGKKTGITSIIEDCKDAVRWLRKNALEHQVIPNKVGVFGNSSGGHLALMIALSPSNTFVGDESLQSMSSQASFAIVVNPITDFPLSAQRLAEEESDDAKKYLKMLKTGLKGSYEEVPQNYAEASPISYVQANSPPVLVLAGKDALEYEQSTVLLKKAKELQYSIVSIDVENVGHEFYQGSEKQEPPKEEVQKKIRAFISDQFELK